MVPVPVTGCDGNLGKSRSEQLAYGVVSSVLLGPVLPKDLLDSDFAETVSRCLLKLNEAPISAR